MKPVIGITPSPTRDELPHGTFDRHVVGDGYVAAVLAAGGLPVVLPPLTGDVEQVLDVVDGLLLSGGADVDPARYGDAEVHPATYGIDARRDAFEIALVHGAVARGVPVFGVCRGIQVLNVALGGTLIQDVSTAGRNRRGESVPHRQQDVGLAADAIGHGVDVRLAGVAAEVFAAGPLGVNSFHHQAIDRIASDLVPVAHSTDDLIEAVVHAGRSWVLGVQWHPELMYQVHAGQLAPFRGLVEAAAERRAVNQRPEG